MNALNHRMQRGLAACLSALLFAACGGSRDGTASGNSPGSTSAAQAAAAGREHALAVAATPGDAYILAPRSRTLSPVAIYTTNGTTQNAGNVLSGGAALILGKGSYITLDFSKEVAGLVTLQFAAASSTGESVGLAFTESPEYVGTASDGSNWGSSNTDGAIYTTPSSTGSSSYTMPASSLRGGFRYLTVFMNSGGWIHLGAVTLNFTAAPLMADPGAYPNYFYSNDDLLNKLWYAGAYTVQTNTIAPTQGRTQQIPGWDNSATISGGNSVLSDGAKRDRMVWPGDVGISGPTAYVSTGDTESVRNALQRMYDSQRASGELPFCGPPFNIFDSDTYHLWTLIGTWNHYLYSGDQAWVASNWPRYKSAMAYIRGKVNGAHGLLNITGTNDWARGNPAGENIAPNAMLYRALTTGALLARAMGDSGTASTYETAAVTLKANINATLWDATLGAYRDNPTSTLYPQDGNSLAVWYGVTDSADKPGRVAAYLDSNLDALGAKAPEWGNNISPFAGSMQLMAMLGASNDVAALSLIRREWGYMFNHANGTKTFWEGYGADGGSGGYAPWYMSRAHGWSTGPTSALTFYTLGIEPTAAQGAGYKVIPHPGDLTHVQGLLNVAAGKQIRNAWDHRADGSFSMSVDTSTNTGSVGVIGVPRFGIDRVITVNGQVAWNGTAFTGAAGVGSADQDAYYVYFRNVQPGARTVAYTASSATWATCAGEGGQCVFNGTRGVRYGAGSSFVYGSFSNGVACSNATFGDPTPKTLKHCELSDTELPPSPGAWTRCAAENEPCAFSNTKTVAYGARGSYILRSATDGTACNNAAAGDRDPIFGVPKACYVADLPQNAGFEAPALTGALYNYNPSGVAWVFSPQNGNSGSGIASNGSAFGTRSAPQGTQVAFLQNNAAMTQTLSNLSAGSYALSFQAARRAFGGQQSFSASIDGQVVGTWSPGSALYSPFASEPIALGAGNHVLSFSGQNVTGDNTAFVDAVVLTRY